MTQKAAAAPIEAALGGETGKQVTMVSPEAEQLSLYVGATALTKDGHGEQFAVACRGRLGTRAAQERGQVLADVIYDVIDPQAKVIEIGYYHAVLPGCGSSQHLIHSAVEDVVSNCSN